MVYIYAMECYSAIKNENLPFSTTWMDPEDIMLSEISQRKKNINDITYMCNLKKIKQTSEY